MGLMRYPNTKNPLPKKSKTAAKDFAERTVAANKAMQNFEPSRRHRRTTHFALKELDVISEALMSLRDSNEIPKGSKRVVKALIDEFCDAWIEANNIRKVKKTLEKLTQGKPEFKGFCFPDQPVVPLKPAVFDGKVKMFTGILRGNGIGKPGTDPSTW